MRIFSKKRSEGNFVYYLYYVDFKIHFPAGFPDNQEINIDFPITELYGP